MLLDFDISKAIAATAYVIEREGGQDDMFCLIKKLYYADRTALIRWGKSISGDQLASLEKGPIVSGIYNLMKGKGPVDDQIRWDDVDRSKRAIYDHHAKISQQGSAVTTRKRGFGRICPDD